MLSIISLLIEAMDGPCLVGREVLKHLMEKDLKAFPGPPPPPSQDISTIVKELVYNDKVGCHPQTVYCAGCSAFWTRESAVWQLSWSMRQYSHSMSRELGRLQRRWDSSRCHCPTRWCRWWRWCLVDSRQLPMHISLLTSRGGLLLNVNCNVEHDDDPSS